MSETHLELDEYLEEYRHRRKTLLNEKPENLIHEYSESVLTTWESSFRVITNRSPEASSLLKLLAFIHCDDVMPELFDLARDTMQKDRNKEDGAAT